MGAAFGTMAEIRELKTEIAGLRTDLKRFVERANQQHTDVVLASLRKEYAGIFSDQQVKNAQEDLSARMVGDCGMRETCYGVFMEFLENSARHIRDGEVSPDLIASYRSRMKEIRKKGPYKQCSTCFAEVGRLFEKQVELMETLGICKKELSSSSEEHGLADESVVAELLEPVANVQRYQIAKALAAGTRTFSEISQLTGLRGGNLLFHIRKLADAGMIVQRHERGDYIITDKGYRTLKAVSDLHAAICAAE